MGRKIHSMECGRLVFAAVVAALWCGHAYALPMVEVETNWAGVHEDAVSTTPSGPVVSGKAYSDEGHSNSSISNTGLSTCGVGASCGAATPGTGAALSRAEANGSAGVLRARAVALGGSDATSELEGFAIATSRLTDTVTFQGSTTVHFDFDVQAQLFGFGGTEIVITFGLPADGFLGGLSCGGDPECVPEDIVLAQLVAGQGDNETDGRSDFYMLTIRDVVVDSGDSIPGSFEFDVDLSTEWLLASQFNNGLLDFFVELRVAANSVESGTAIAAADNSLYVEIDDVISANGYSYLGRQSTPPDGELNVPEPTSLALFASGLAGLGLMRRRRAA